MGKGSGPRQTKMVEGTLLERAAERSEREKAIKDLAWEIERRGGQARVDFLRGLIQDVLRGTKDQDVAIQAIVRARATTEVEEIAPRARLLMR